MPPDILTTEAALAWAAGFIDGEGYVAFREQGKRATKAPGRGYGRIVLTVAQVDRRPLEKLFLLFGGRINGPYKHGTNKQFYFNWSIQGACAVSALSMLKEYLLVKREDVEAALSEYFDYRTYLAANPLRRGPEPKVVTCG